MPDRHSRGLRPVIDLAAARHLATQLQPGRSVRHIRELDSYDDRNFCVTFSPGQTVAEHPTYSSQPVTSFSSQAHLHQQKAVLLQAPPVCSKYTTLPRLGGILRSASSQKRCLVLACSSHSLHSLSAVVYITRCKVCPPGPYAQRTAQMRNA